MFDLNSHIKVEQGPLALPKGLLTWILEFIQSRIGSH